MMKSNIQSVDSGYADPEIARAIEEVLAQSDDDAQDREHVQRLCLALRDVAPEPRPAFRHDLKQSLIQHLDQQHQQGRRPMFNTSVISRTLRSLIRGSSPTRFAVGLLVMSLLVAIPVVGQTILEHVAPRGVKTLPSGGVSTIEPTPTGRSSSAVAALQTEVDFPVLVPTYLPADCLSQGRFSRSIGQGGIKEAVLNYTCVSIVERGAAGTHQPYVGEHAASQVLVHGKPAWYINGMWEQEEGQDDLVWKEGSMQQLIFEDQGLIIRFTASPTTLLPKDELIRIAESLQPAN